MNSSYLHGILAAALLAACSLAKAQESAETQTLAPVDDTPSPVLTQAAPTNPANYSEVIERLGQIEDLVKARQNISSIDEKFILDALEAMKAELREELTAARAENAESARVLREAIQKLPSKTDITNALAVGGGAPEEAPVTNSRITTIGAIGCALAALSTLVALAVLLRLKSIQTELPQLLSRPMGNGSGASSSASLVSGNGVGLSRLEEKLGAIQHGISQLRDSRPEPKQNPAELSERLSAIDAALEKLAAVTVASSSLPAKDDSPPINDSIWPKTARAFETFPIWRKALADMVARSDSEGLKFASLLLEYQAKASSKDNTLDQFCELVTSLGKAVYRFCYALDIAEGDRLDAASALLKQAKEDAAAYPGLEIRAFFPNDRLNTDLMEKMDSGNRLSVSRPQSWLIQDKTPGKERILARAMVITG
ncbi:MAG: hypothetical protein JW942_09125 [Opitutales bacterium]|nr:hypothetical protein [Opitutales bacterium]